MGLESVDMLDMKSGKGAVDFMVSGCNCSQAVVAAFAEEMGVSKERALHIAERFASGTYSVCGAVLGMSIVLNGILDDESEGESPIEVTDRSRLAIEQVQGLFLENNGSIMCRELRGSLADGCLRSCRECVADAERILREFLRMGMK